MLIHPLLRDGCGIDGEEVSVVGQKEYVEVWKHTTLKSDVEDNPVTDDVLHSLRDYDV